MNCAYKKYVGALNMNSNNMISNVGKNANDTAALVWSVADDLVGAYKPHK